MGVTKRNDLEFTPVPEEEQVGMVEMDMLRGIPKRTVLITHTWGGDPEAVAMIQEDRLAPMPTLTRTPFVPYQVLFTRDKCNGCGEYHDEHVEHVPFCLN